MKLTRKEHKAFFDFLDIDDTMDFFQVDSDEEYRGRGSTFYRVDVLEIKPEHQKEDWVDIDLTPYLGNWQTNRWIFDPEYGSDDEIYELTKVEKHETTETITKVEWVEAA